MTTLLPDTSSNIVTEITNLQAPKMAYTAILETKKITQSPALSPSEIAPPITQIGTPSDATWSTWFYEMKLSCLLNNFTFL